MNRETLSSILLILLFGFVIYLPALPAPFHLDDFPHLVENPHIKNLADAGAIWNHWPSRFVGFWTFALNYSFGRLDPGGYRAFNIAVHLVGGGFAYFLTRRLAGLAGKTEESAGRIALWTALIFVCHPVQTQAVTYIVQRLASLAGVLALAALLCYLSARAIIDRGGEFRSPKHLFLYTLGLLSSLMAMTTKESAVMIPVLVLSLELLFPRRGVPIRKRIFYYLPYALTVLVVPALTLYMASGRGTRPFYYQMNIRDAGRLYVMAQDVYIESRGQYLLTQLRALLIYLRLTIIPARQSIYYDLPVSRSIFSTGTYPALFLVSGLLFAAAGAVRRFPLVTLAIVWFFLNLLPSSSVAVVWPFVSEHHLYLPVFSGALLSGLFLGWVGEKFGAGRAKFLGWLLLCSLSLLTLQRNQLWGDTYRLWRNALESAPDSPNVHNALAGALVREGRYREAEAAALRALELNPRLNAYHNLWAAYFNLGDLSAARAAARRHGELFPVDPRSGINLGMTLLKKEDYPAARDILFEASRRHPGSAITRFWLGVSYYHLEEDEAAIGEFSLTLDLNPDYPAAYDYLGRLYQRSGEGDKALEIYRRGARLNPGSLILNYNLGMLAWRKGQPELAGKHLGRARGLAGDERMRGMIEAALEQLSSGSPPPGVDPPGLDLDYRGDY